MTKQKPNREQTDIGFAHQQQAIERVNKSDLKVNRKFRINTWILEEGYGVSTKYFRNKQPLQYDDGDIPESHEDA